MNNKNIMNAAIQMLPMSIEEQKAYAAIDEAIHIVEKSGLVYKVCPFETVVEGTYEQVMTLITDMQNAVFNHHVEHLIVNLKLQRKKNASVYIDDKVGKYEHQS